MVNNSPSQSSHDNFTEDAGMHLLDYLQILRRRWRIALFCFLLVFSVVAIKTFLTKPVFEAYSVLEIRKGERRGVLESFDLEQDNSLSTAIEILKSRTIVSTVVRDLGLNWQVSPPEFSSKIELKKIQLPPDRERYQVTYWS